MPWFLLRLQLAPHCINEAASDSSRPMGEGEWDPNGTEAYVVAAPVEGDMKPVDVSGVLHLP